MSPRSPARNRPTCSDPRTPGTVLFRGRSPTACSRRPWLRGSSTGGTSRPPHVCSPWTAGQRAWRGSVSRQGRATFPGSLREATRTFALLIAAPSVPSGNPRRWISSVDCQAENALSPCSATYVAACQRRLDARRVDRAVDRVPALPAHAQAGPGGFQGGDAVSRFFPEGANHPVAARCPGCTVRGQTAGGIDGSRIGSVPVRDGYRGSLREAIE